jgi:hypothetical protein
VYGKNGFQTIKHGVLRSVTRQDEFVGSSSSSLTFGVGQIVQMGVGFVRGGRFTQQGFGGCLQQVGQVHDGFFATAREGGGIGWWF